MRPTKKMLPSLGMTLSYLKIAEDEKSSQSLPRKNLLRSESEIGEVINQGTLTSPRQPDCANYKNTSHVHVSLARARNNIMGYGRNPSQNTDTYTRGAVSTARHWSRKAIKIRKPARSHGDYRDLSCAKAAKQPAPTPEWGEWNSKYKAQPCEPCGFVDFARVM